jgi:hypothetical protein
MHPQIRERQLRIVVKHPRDLPRHGVGREVPRDLEQHPRDRIVYDHVCRERHTDLTEQIHTLSQRLSTLIEEAHEATCERGKSPA